MCLWAYTHYKLYIVTTRTFRPNVSRRCFERLVSVSSRTSGTDVSISSWSRHHTCHLITTLFCRPTRNCGMANRLHIAKQGYGCACQNGGGFHSQARLQFTNIEKSKILRVYIVGQLANKVRVRVQAYSEFRHNSADVGCHDCQLWWKDG